MCAAISDSSSTTPTYQPTDLFDADLQKDMMLEAMLDKDRPTIQVRKQDGILFLEVDFSQMGRLKDPMAELGEEGRKEWYASITKHVFKLIESSAKEHGCPVVFEKVVLDGTQASLRCVIQLADQLRVLHMNRTNISESSFRNLYQWTKLEELHLDRCPGISGEIFESLTDSPIRRLSLVNLEKELPLGWVVSLTQRCRSLEELYISRNLTERCEGLSDVVTFQTLRDPHLSSCGHVEEKATIDGRDDCSFCREDYNRDKMTPFRPRVFRRYKEGRTWKSEPVDAKRRSLDERVLYHTTCGELFNAQTIQDIFMKALSLKELQDETCPTCQSEFKDTLRVCYIGDIKGGTLAEDGFAELEDLGNYVMPRAGGGGKDQDV
ncbi:MAG: hypothetical protein ACE5GN_00915 [Waddliaceae bacterium]